MSDLKNLTKTVLDFRDARNWRQFHTPKDLAISLSLEAGEVMEHFQWKNDKMVKEHVRKNKEEIGDELADVLIYLIQLADVTDIDIVKAAMQKMKKNALKYPVEEASSKATKYTKL